VQIGDVAEPLLTPQRIVKVHGAAAGHEEDVLYALFGDHLHDVIGKFHRDESIVAGIGC